MDDIKITTLFLLQEASKCPDFSLWQKIKKPYLIPHGFVFYYAYLRTQNSHRIRKYLVPNLHSVKGACYYCRCCCKLKDINAWANFQLRRLQTKCLHRYTGSSCKSWSLGQKIESTILAMLVLQGQTSIQKLGSQYRVLGPDAVRALMDEEVGREPSAGGFWVTSKILALGVCKRFWNPDFKC